jgi:hypothetical protein
VLLVMIDVSKTGLIAPSPACVARLNKRLPAMVDVMVDACQFRIAPVTLRAYLQHGFMVALTGSKFVTGPAFSGALLIPAGLAARLRSRPLPPAMASYSTQAEWPSNWSAVESLGDAGNFGLLLRWEAALAELRAFRAVPELQVADILWNFGAAVQSRLQGDLAFEALPAPELDRSALSAAEAWDCLPTIFPFLLIRRGRLLNRKQTQNVYRLLQSELTGPDFAGIRCQLGQPVNCGVRDGAEVSALRMCVSARLVVEAACGETEMRRMIWRAGTVLDKAAWLVEEGEV